MTQKLPKIAQKLAPAKKNSRDISPVSPTFSISAMWLQLMMIMSMWLTLMEMSLMQDLNAGDSTLSADPRQTNHRKFAKSPITIIYLTLIFMTMMKKNHS